MFERKYFFSFGLLYNYNRFIEICDICTELMNTLGNGALFDVPIIHHIATLPFFKGI